MSSVVTLYGMKELADDRTSDFKVDWLDPKQNIGIEIEVEREGGTTINTENLNLWTVKSDGSLRRGVEFVLSRPMKGDALSAAIDEFFQYNTVHRSPTSGTHIHMDMRDKDSTLDVVKTLGAIMVCIEPAIYGMFAEGREWSGYTNPLTSLPDDPAFSLFSDRAQDGDFVGTFNNSTREYKYYGFNMLPLARYGSVEFRYFPTTTSAEELVEWVQFCMAVKQAAVKLNQRANLKYFISTEATWDEFLCTHFPQWRDRMVEFLPQKDVYIRYKQARARNTKGVTMGKVKPFPTLTSEVNPLGTTRFKKFFAMKVQTEEGKTKLVYDLPSIAALRPTRVFIDMDEEMNSYEFRKMDGDWLLSGSILYRYDMAAATWREVFFFTLPPSRADRITETGRGMSQSEFAGIERALQARFNGNTGGLDLYDLRSATNAHRIKLERVLALMRAAVAPPAAVPAPEALAETDYAAAELRVIAGAVPPPPGPGSTYLHRMEEAIRRTQEQIVQMNTVGNTVTARNPRS